MSLFLMRERERERRRGVLFRSVTINGDIPRCMSICYALEMSKKWKGENLHANKLEKDESMSVSIISDLRIDILCSMINNELSA